MTRVLFVSPQRLGCGEAEFGRLWARELRKVGVSVHEWDGSWPAVYQRGHVYLPDDLRQYDLIHLNWGPANMGHYLPSHFPRGKPLSLFLCDVPPHSSTDLQLFADLVWATEPAENATVIKHHLPPYQGPFVLPPPPEKPRIGITGIRKDSGTQLVRDLCAARGWELSESSPKWYDTDEEIARLASCTLNVCWYKETGRGTSMGAAYALAARRPLILSGSSMFDYLEPWRDEVYRSHERGPAALAALVGRVLDDITERRDRQPSRVLTELAWGKLAREIKARWEGVVGR